MNTAQSFYDFSEEEQRDEVVDGNLVMVKT